MTLYSAYARTCFFHLSSCRASKTLFQQIGSEHSKQSSWLDVPVLHRKNPAEMSDDTDNRLHAAVLNLSRTMPDFRRKVKITPDMYYVTCRNYVRILV